MQKSILYLASFLIVLSSCVTPKIHNALISENEVVKYALNTEEKKAFKLGI